MSSEIERKFHETWLGMVQPVEGLVVSIPVLLDAQCMERQPPHVQAKLVELCPPRVRSDAGDEGHTLAALPRLLEELLGFAPDAFDAGESLPRELSLYVPEGRQTLAPSRALRKVPAPERTEAHSAESTPASRAGERYELLVWELPSGLDFDKPETATGPWDYPPAAKFDRLLRHTRVPVGLLCNDEALRLVYAPHGESSGAITFRFDDMVSVGGRPILDALVMLLSANRVSVLEDLLDAKGQLASPRKLATILSESRKRQANVTNDLADQVFEALGVLLRGFEAAAERDGRALLDDALGREGDHLYKGLLTVLLRLVFVLFAEDRGLLPVEQPVYAEHYSVLALFGRLQAEHGAYPDSMSRRFSAWGRLVALFRAIYVGVDHGALHMPPRRGDLFDPHRFPFLEGWGPAGSAPIANPEERAAVRVPTVDDETVFKVLSKLLLFEGQRLSYRALDVEQIGSVYEGLMGYHVVRLSHDAVCTKPHRLWVAPGEVLAVAPAQRAKWVKENLGLATKQSEQLAKELGPEAPLETLAKYAAGGRNADPALSRARAGQLVLQPGQERRRTSSHYTPRSLSSPIVQRTLEPLLKVMGESPASERILSLKVCDPAMGSGAFLVEACRYLADRVLAAWTREGAMEAIGREHGDPLLHARRLVAQRCLYGVDKNEAAVELAKLSLWLVTLARDLPFTFVDHALRHGDSLVGLDFEQIRSFHWKPGKQQELFAGEVRASLEEAIALREKILALAGSKNPVDQREKERLLWDAEDAMQRVRLVADVVVGAFFAKEKDKEREKERTRRLELVGAWLRGDEGVKSELVGLQAELRARVPAFHWHIEFPEVFYSERPDPLDDMKVSGAACMDAFVGNPPFADKNAISATLSPRYIHWLLEVHSQSHGNSDISAHFFRRCGNLLGHNGSMALIATNTIAQGDTRSSGLQHLLRDGFVIYSADPSFAWPGDAAVSVSIVHLARGTAIQPPHILLSNRSVTLINSRLQAAPEASDPVALVANQALWYQGAKVYGSGFMLSPDERTSMLKTEPAAAAVILPYLGGEEINSNPDQGFDRYVISFGQKSLDDAKQWPTALKTIVERVKPERDTAREDTADGAHRKKYWWQFAQPRPELFEAISLIPRCLVSSRVTKHLVFSFQPSGRIFAESANVFTFHEHSQFCILQSRIHEPWARLHSSSLEDRLRYNASDAFETFPFPQPDPRTVIPALEALGETLYTQRAAYMVAENVGLTITYNRLKDPSVDAPAIVALRTLHEELDRAVLTAYGWADLHPRVPPFCIATPEDKRALEAFENEVIDRLFALNAKRAQEEKILGLGGAPSKSKPAKGAKSAAATTSASPAAPAHDDDAPGSAPAPAKPRATRAKKTPAQGAEPELALAPAKPESEG